MPSRSPDRGNHAPTGYVALVMRPRPLAVASALVAAALLAACGGDDPTLDPPASPTAGAAGEQATEPPVASDAATAEAGATSSLWRGAATTVSGEDLDLAAYAGRDVAVWFWAPW